MLISIDLLGSISLSLSPAKWLNDEHLLHYHAATTSLLVSSFRFVVVFVVVPQVDCPSFAPTHSLNGAHKSSSAAVMENVWPDECRTVS